MAVPEFTSNEAEIYYEVRGEGKPILFTHGASWNHMQWEKQVEYFSKEYQVITWDVRGHGYSSLPKREVNSEEFSEDLITLMNELHLKKAAICALFR